MLLFMQIEDVRIARGFFKEKCKPQCICIGVGTRLFEIKELHGFQSKPYHFICKLQLDAFRTSVSQSVPQASLSLQVFLK